MSAEAFLSVAISSIAATMAYHLKYLTVPATLVAALLGSVIVIFGGWEWGVTTAGSFLATAVISKRENRLVNFDRAGGDSRRNLYQVLANGLLLMVLAVLYGLTAAPVLVAAFLGSVGAVAGDTWATSSATFSARSPRLLTSGIKVPAGTPGAVSAAGIALSAAAGLFAFVLYISAAMIFSEALNGVLMATLGFVAIIGAAAGSLFDSYLGAARQAIYTDSQGLLTDQAVASIGRSNSYVRGWRWLTNDLVNFSNAVAGASSATLVWLVAISLEIV